MDQCAERGFDVWTMDHEGYGRSTRTTTNSNVACGVEDLAAASRIVERETGQGRIHLYGQSSGALRAAAFAQAQPGRIHRLILDAFVWTGEGSPTLAERRRHIERWRSSNMRKLDRDF